MKVLLDTNILIEREAHNSKSFSIGYLMKWLDNLNFKKMIHPLSIEELSKYGDEKNKEVLLRKLNAYQELTPATNFSDKFSSVIKKYSLKKDYIDNNLLYQVFIGRVDILITEDRLIHKKAVELDISNKVYSTNDFITCCSSAHPEFIKYKYIPVEKVKFGKIDINVDFFKSLKDNYAEFDKWYNKKSEEDVYVSTIDKQIVGFLYIKKEDEKEDYSNITPTFEKKKRLKIGTMKVESTGFRLGERLLKIVFDNALLLKVDEIYVTFFENNGTMDKFKNMLLKWGFYDHGLKKGPNGDESVLVKKMVYDSNKNPRENFPMTRSEINKFILPIEQKYHTSLFPESQLNNEKTNYVHEAHRFAIQKVYISATYKEKEVKPGDLILIYRKGDPNNARYTGVMTTLTIVLDIKKVYSKDILLRECENRTVFTKQELEGFYPKYNTVIKILELKPLKKR